LSEDWEPSPARPLGRAWRLLTRPDDAWREIAAEPLRLGRLLGRYVAPFAAIPAVCGLAGPLIFSFAMASVRLRPDPAALALEMAARYAVTLAGVFILAGWIALWAPAFGGRRAGAQAIKLVAYSAAAVWLSGVFALYPNLGLPAALLGGLLSLFMLYRGLPLLMGADGERLLVYFAVVLLGLGALTWAGATLASRAAGLGGPLAVG
jgi:hypothetical protein